MGLFNSCILLVLGCLVGYCSGQGNPTCPLGQVYRTCGSACNRTCENPNPICTANCVARCECPSDRLLFNRTCIERTKCPTNTTGSCKFGQIFKPCASACERTCDSPDPICTKQCVQRCECPSNRPLLFNGTCIQRTRCPANTNGSCKFGQIFNKCGSACEKSCDNPNPVCTLQCVGRCECPSNRPLLFNGTCIQQTRCPTKRNQTCPLGQEFTQCGSACNRTCENPLPRCTELCVPRCQCPSLRPYLFNGTCLEMNRCPANRRCDNSYSPMEPYLVNKTCSVWRFIKPFKFVRKTIACPVKRCCPGYQMYWNKCKVGCGGCRNTVVPNQETCKRWNFHQFRYEQRCCAGFRMVTVGDQTRCLKERTP